MRTALITGFVAVLCHVYAQNFPRKDFNLEKLVDEIFPIQDLDLNYQELYENLGQLLSHPLDLNGASSEQLRSLFVVTEEEVNSFLEYRETNGPLLSVYELQSIPGWTRTTFERIIPFVTVYDSESKLDRSILHRLLQEKNNYILLRYDRTLETRQGYKSTTDSSQRYAGSADRFYVRFRVARPNDFSLGFTMEKDPGESMRWSPTQKHYGFDYMSTHAQVQNKGKVKNLIVGDFQAQFGQGLILGSVFGFGKNSETVTTVRRSNLGFLPYTSLNESLYFRGAAMSYALARNMVIHVLLSRSYKDGIVNHSAEENTVITSFSATGLHRTGAERQARKQIGETDAATVIQFKNQNIDAALILHHIDFDRPVLRKPYPYNQFAFSGSRNQNAGIYLNYSWSGFTFFGEAAQTISNGRSFTAGILGNVARRLEVSLLYRDFAKDFYSFNANAFTESTLPQNERGFYWGWKYSFSKHYSVSSYLDLFQFPWLRYRSYSPSEGSEWLFRFNYTPNRSVLLFLQAREESKNRNFPDESNLYLNTQGVKRNYWINCDYAAPPYFIFKTRAQFSTYQAGSSLTRGFALVQDVNFSVERWTLSMRYALFDTDDYDNRIYLYERDVWLACSFPAFYGVGVRNYALIQYKLSRKIDLWLRWSHIRYVDRNEIGSGNDAIAGNTGNDIKFQVRARL